MKNIFVVIISIILISSCNTTRKTYIKTIDTDFSKGRLKNIQNITLQDAVKLHGHLCDGLVVGFVGLKEGLYQLYPNKIIDRTNTRIVSRSSPCLTDIAIFMTGGRYQYNTFYVSDSIPFLFVVQRIDNQKTYGIKLKNGIKPKAIDSLGSLAIKGELSPCGIDSLKLLEEKFSKYILSHNAQDIFDIQVINNFQWKPILINNFFKTDVLNKNLPACSK